MNKTVIFRDLGHAAYKETWDLQESMLQDIVRIKMENREHGRTDETTNHLLFVEHPHVYTLGKSGKPEHLLLSQQEMEEKGITYFKINRGGDITYHGPGQIVGYPILDLENFKTDINWYLRLIEESVIQTIAEYGVEGTRIDGLTGVWVDADGENPRKICAIGVRCSRWVTMHGFAFNVNTDLDYFGHIIPCGIDDKGVTSLAKELGRECDYEEVKSRLLKKLGELFEWVLDTQSQPKGWNCYSN